MNYTNAYRTMSYKVDDAPGLAYYEPHPDILYEMVFVLGKIPAEGTVEISIPRIDDAVLTARRIGKGLAMSASVAATSEDNAPNVAVFFADDEESAKIACEEALKLVPEFGIEHIVHPEWAEAMAKVPEAPFTIILPNLAAADRIRHDPATMNSFKMTTGFFQAFIGAALQQAGHPTMPYIDGGDDEFDTEDEDFGDGLDFAAAVQTGGEPHNTLIVRKTPDGWPAIYAHLLDVEVDLFTITFESDGTMMIDTSDLGYLQLDAGTIVAIAKLHNEAGEVWNEVNEIFDDVGAPGDRAIDEDAADPLEHLYTHHKDVEVPAELADKLLNEMGLRRPGKDAEEHEGED